MGEFAFVPHTADIALQVSGKDLADLLRTAALGMSAALTDREEWQAYRAPEATPRALESDAAPDEEGLLINFLNEIIYQAEVSGEVFSDYEILSAAVQEGVRARAYPDPGTTPSISVKAATYYDLQVRHTESGLEATVVLDV